MHCFACACGPTLKQEALSRVNRVCQTCTWRLFLYDQCRHVKISMAGLFMDTVCSIPGRYDRSRSIHDHKSVGFPTGHGYRMTTCLEILVLFMDTLQVNGHLFIR
jgi:hypothetical protein